MSMKILTEVWHDAPAQGGDLLVLLAIADAADDDHRMSWLSVPTIAKRARLTERSVYRSLSNLQAAGLLVNVDEADAPKSAHGYSSAVRMITVKSDWKPVAQTPDITSGLTPTAPNPSITTAIGNRNLEELRSSGSARKRARGKTAGETEDDPQSHVLAELETPSAAPSRRKRTLDDPLQPRRRAKRLGPADNLVRYWSSAAAPFTSEKISPTNQRELRGSIQRWLNDGTSYNVIVSMIGAYWDPTFQRSDHVVAWKDFLAKRDVLASQSRKEESIAQAEDDRYDPTKW